MYLSDLLAVVSWKNVLQEEIKNHSRYRDVFISKSHPNKAIPEDQYHLLPESKLFETT